MPRQKLVGMYSNLRIHVKIMVRMWSNVSPKAYRCSLVIRSNPGVLHALNFFLFLTSHNAVVVFSFSFRIYIFTSNETQASRNTKICVTHNCRFAFFSFKGVTTFLNLRTF